MIAECVLHLVVARCRQIEENPSDPTAQPLSPTPYSDLMSRSLNFVQLPDCAMTDVDDQLGYQQVDLRYKP